ncbi:cysteine-rich PDZ-binding protein-like protein [Ochromonadaceae sp. CCMP2298]|nr:cysteine-rich PDZ-binding protein-like protein [Ochromonadaceae sp. CCMP2298]|mmetsp:Transcript_16847/g.37401  ORF Transcript_16847/g.37401 Transcript_16847/m.37401 type:complete len:101 (+) Transcript_16847:122-424(+)
MVCESCQLKSKNVCVPDKWKDGARNTIGSAGPVRAGKTNKALAAAKHGAQWIPTNSTCRLCKSKLQLGMHYCNDCAHKKGICAMCGKKTVDTSAHKMTLV